MICASLAFGKVIYVSQGYSRLIGDDERVIPECLELARFVPMEAAENESVVPPIADMNGRSGMERRAVFRFFLGWFTNIPTHPFGYWCLHKYGNRNHAGLVA